MNFHYWLIKLHLWRCSKLAFNHVDVDRLMVAPDCDMGFLILEQCQLKLTNLGD